ncbi:MAG TPA: ABC transporter ATP-binding protein [Burkholderiales bacterium]|nr:ABC transporter ATP-binding protein [Burkholderiales bacterium]
MDVSVRFVKNLDGFAMDVSWEAANEIVVLFGPSGAGKSMTFQAIAGLTPLHEGKISVGGKVFYDSAMQIDLPPQRREVGYLFQHYALFPHMNARENILYGHSDPACAKEDFSEMIELFHLCGLEMRFPNELSGGQKQRVALARALMRKPGILLLDEPLSAIDLAVRRAIRNELKALQRKLSIPMVIVTHDLGEALTMADRLIVYNRGRVIQAAPPMEVVEHPADEMVAELVGSIRLDAARLFSF